MIKREQWDFYERHDISDISNEAECARAAWNEALDAAQEKLHASGNGLLGEMLEDMRIA